VVVSSTCFEVRWGELWGLDLSGRTDKERCTSGILKAEVGSISTMKKGIDRIGRQFTPSCRRIFAKNRRLRALAANRTERKKNHGLGLIGLEATRGELLIT
jgi:hypothetical protein